MKKLLIPTLVVLCFGCDKEETKTGTSSDEALNALSEYVIVNKVFQDIGNNNGDAVLSAESSASDSQAKSVEATALEADITITPFDLITFPKTIMLDFKTGVLGPDGITRKGKISIVSTDWYREPGSIHTATFTDYYHNEYKVEGTHVVENLGPDSDGNLEYSVAITDGKITAQNGTVIEYKENSTRTWIAGSETPLYIWDDEYLWNGSQNGTSSTDLDYSLTTDEPLHFVLLPRSIQSGILDVDVADIKDIKINFSTSTITILGKVYPFTK
ncbi:hypothetical protein [Flagellimonas iocasae]|uniref:Lipoprotein n=1 Tax=Flagellimonas iocasae TaxID=2055905 RepID=A0ABW4XT41_9FLAO